MTKGRRPREVSQESAERGDDLMGLSSAELRKRALNALRQNRFNLADDLLKSGDPRVDTLVENLRIYQTELEIQNEELIQSQQRTQEALARFTSFFNTLPVAELVIDRKGLIREANLAAQRLFRLRGSHFHQHFFARLIEEPDRASVIGVWGNLARDQTALLSEIRFRVGRDGGFIGDLHIAPIPTLDDEGVQYVCAIIDRTEAVRQRQSLQETGERLRHSEISLRERLKELATLHDVLSLTSQCQASVREVLRLLVERLPAGWRYPRLVEARIRLPEICVATPGFAESEWMCTVPIPLDGGLIGDLTVLYREPPPGEEGDPFQREECRLIEAIATHVSVYLARVRDEERLRDSRERYRVLADFSSDWEYWLGPDGRYIYVSPACARITGYPPEDFLADAALLSRLVLPADLERWHAHGERLHQDPAAELQRLEFRIRARSGEERWVEHICNPVVREDGRFLGRRGVNRDITERVEAEKSLRQAARVFESTAEGVMITDPAGRILAVNPAFTEITGYSEAEVFGRTPRLLQSGRHDEDFYRAMWDELGRTGRWRGEIWNRHKDGRIYPQLLTISAVFDNSEASTHYVGVFSDITQIKRSEQQLEYLAHHDALTGLPNRSLFQKRLDQCLQRARRYQRQVGLLFIDLDRFKEVNDTLGHHVGDALLKQVAEVLSRQVREVDTIARLGGDEFVIILEDIPAPRFAATFADRLMEDFARPFQVEGRELFVTASIGISLYPEDGADMDALVRHADIAMYQAKRGGRNAFSFFEPSMSEGAVERLHLEQDLRLALQRDEFVLHYQPQLALDSGELRGIEALCRWQHPQLGLLPPETFIPVANELGLSEPLYLWVLERGCRQAAAWRRAGLTVPRLAVNLTVRDIERARLVVQVGDILRRTGFPPEGLELEFTESIVIANAEAAIGVLRALHAMGVTLALDDFGTGCSSLSQLRRLPLTRLKIDHSFIDGLPRDRNDEAIVRAVIALAHSLGLEVLAEGVETPEQAELLFNEGCGEGQGFLFSRPVTPEELAANWLSP